MKNKDFEIVGDLYGHAEELVRRMVRLSNGYCHTDFGDTIGIYREAVEIRDGLAQLVYEHDIEKETSK